MVYFWLYAADCMPSFNPIMIENYAALKLQGGGLGLRLKDGFGVNPRIVGWSLMIVIGWTYRG